MRTAEPDARTHHRENNRPPHRAVLLRFTERITGRSQKASHEADGVALAFAPPALRPIEHRKRRGECTGQNSGATERGRWGGTPERRRGAPRRRKSLGFGGSAVGWTIRQRSERERGKTDISGAFAKQWQTLSFQRAQRRPWSGGVWAEDRLVWGNKNARVEERGRGRVVEPARAIRQAGTGSVGRSIGRRCALPLRPRIDDDRGETGARGVRREKGTTDRTEGGTEGIEVGQEGQGAATGGRGGERGALDGGDGCGRGGQSRAGARGGKRGGVCGEQMHFERTNTMGRG